MGTITASAWRPFFVNVQRTVSVLVIGNYFFVNSGGLHTLQVP